MSMAKAQLFGADNPYGWPHQQERARWQRRIDKGEAIVCRRASDGTCVMSDPRIYPNQEWDLGHPDAACRATKAPEHLLCNRRVNATERRAARAAQQRHSRVW